MAPAPADGAHDAPTGETADALAADLFGAEAKRALEAALPRPAATYRLQMHRGFRVDDLTAIVDYLDALGVTDCYMSPFHRARPGSTHGYDVFDHGQLNPEIGDESAHARLLERLSAHGMRRLIDVVPNHMGISGPNPFWLDVLEIGPAAPASRFFDIDWHPVKEELENRVLLPILEDQYGKVLEQNLLVLEREGGSLYIRYHDRRFPLAPKSYATVLARRADELVTRFNAADPHVLEYRSIWAAAHNLPPRDTTDPEGLEQTIREREVIKRRLARLCDESHELCEFLNQSIAAFRGRPGESATFDALHELLDQQVYRLAYWRVAADEINYRRFFDINDLAGLRAEDPLVFDAIHRLVLRWVDDGSVIGLRIDHPDGLADPRAYLCRLQESVFLIDCRRRLAKEHPDADWRLVADALRRRYRDAVEADPASPLARRFPVVVEKILSRGEDLPADWPVDGTVGYEYLNTVNGLFVDPNAAETINAIYTELTGDDEPFAEVLYRSKQLITRAALASEINMLARQLNRVSEGDRRSRDFSLNELRVVLRETIACFPVYRTYVQPGTPIADRDRSFIDQAIARARRRNPTIDASVFAFLRDALLLEHPPGMTPAERALREAFVSRFQQTTGPIQAKGLEDTAFYRQFPLASLNEVGADPARFASSSTGFHALNAQRLKQWPGGLSTTATHDTKRGEDTRIRINVLSELAEDWRVHLARWSRWNAKKKAVVHEIVAPDGREEYFFYQTLVGAWPFGVEDSVPAEFVERFQNYMLKAAREAKLNTTWTDPDSAYADNLSRFVADVLTAADAGPFLKDFVPFQRRIARIGVVHSLAQVLLKLTSPGVPDIYQGCELWDFSLVDPDNRRPVDYGLRESLLGEIQSRSQAGTSRRQIAHDFFHTPAGGGIKLYVTWAVLQHRRANRDLYLQGTYRSIETEGEQKANVISFARSREGKTVVVAAPRLVAGLMGEDGATPPIGPRVWSETAIVLPENSSRRWRNLLTDEIVDADDGGVRLLVGELFQTVPLALLVEDVATNM